MFKGPKTYAFGTGREQFSTTVVNVGNIGADKGNPGPGEYNPLHPLGQDAVGFKLKYRLDFGDADKVAIKRNYPAPGTYEDVLRMDTQGRYTSS